MRNNNRCHVFSFSTHSMLPGRRDRCGDAVDKFKRREDEVGSPIGAGLGEVVDKALGVDLLKSVGCEGRTGAISQQALQSFPVVGLDAYRGVQREPAAVPSASSSTRAPNSATYPPTPAPSRRSAAQAALRARWAAYGASTRRGEAAYSLRPSLFSASRRSRFWKGRRTSSKDTNPCTTKARPTPPKTHQRTGSLKPFTAKKTAARTT